MKNIILIFAFFTIGTICFSQTQPSERHVKKTIKKFVLDHADEFNDFETIIIESQGLTSILTNEEFYSFKVRGKLVVIGHVQYVFSAQVDEYCVAVPVTIEIENMSYKIIKRSRKTGISNKIGILNL